MVERRDLGAIIHENPLKSQLLRNRAFSFNGKPLPSELVVQCHTYDKFYGTHLDLALRSQGIDRFIICGITTDVCVNSTLIAGSTRNYRVTAFSNAMAAVDDHHYDACLQIWENKFARLRTTAELVEEMV